MAYPIARGTAPLLVTLGAWLVLAQRPGLLGVAGAVALALGLGLVGVAGQRAGELVAVGFALLTGVAIATYSVVDARVVQTVAPPGYLGLVLGLEGVVLLGCMRGSGRTHGYQGAAAGTAHCGRQHSGLPTCALRLPTGACWTRLHLARGLGAPRRAALAQPPRVGCVGWCSAGVRGDGAGGRVTA